ncbi:unnamed protein product [Allacma fusca]|uniref:Uncharacterized protein n=2 Tax=Allacma fusca TaxID=39272 RepID=A0A8J2KIT0_9HEXA|nr:unnamed protein product [Allacma fusca]
MEELAKVPTQPPPTPAPAQALIPEGIHEDEDPFEGLSLADLSISAPTMPAVWMMCVITARRCRHKKFWQLNPRR